MKGLARYTGGWFCGLLACLFLFLLPATRASAGENVPDELAPDLILVNGRILTFDDENRVVEAVAIKGQRILAVGSSDSMRKLTGSNTEIIDAGGRLVLPGFVDAHTHYETVIEDVRADKAVPVLRDMLAHAEVSGPDEDSS